MIFLFVSLEVSVGSAGVLVEALEISMNFVDAVICFSIIISRVGGAPGFAEILVCLVAEEEDEEEEAGM